jgi:predicted metalloprotease with PDZ domain
MKIRIFALLLASLLPLSSFAQNRAPQATAIVNTIPDARDIPFEGTIVLKVDATNVDQGIFNVEERIPVQRTGRQVLLFPKWLPGKHAPRGAIEKLAGLIVTGDGRRIEWVRDTVDVFAFHIDVPAGVRELKLNFQYLSPTAPNQGRIEVTPEMMSLQWNSVSLYPAGYYVRNLPISASVTLPSGWKAATSLRPVSTNGDTINYRTVPYDVLIDSPILAGRHFRQVELSPKVTLNIFADAPKYLEFTQAQMAPHIKLVEQAVRTFGSEHYDHYDFLFSLSDTLGGIGLEHHRSSENGVEPGYFTEWATSLPSRNLLPHEYSHSWDGKFRRGADLWTPDYRTPMQNSLMWVYEGQTQFWGYVLGARSGLFTKTQTLEAWASIAADLDGRKGRQWRDLIDTTNDPIITPRSPKAWTSYQRAEDYYNEGMLVWLEIDAKLRELTRGEKGIDSFARAFYGMRDGDFGELTYRFEDIVTTLNNIAPFDWARHLNALLYDQSDAAPLGGFTASGYALVFNDTPNEYIRAVEGAQRSLNMNYSLGMTVGNDGLVNAVIWEGLAFKAGFAVGDKIIAINGKAWGKEAAIDAIKAAKNSDAPLQLIVLASGIYKVIPIDYHGGIRYPHFEKTGPDGALDRLLEPLG